MKNVYNTLKFKHIGFLKLTLAVLLMLSFGVKSWGQVSYLGLDGGLEGSATIDNTTAQTLPAAGVWRKANASQTLANEISTVRSGANSLRVNNSSATGRRVWSPNFTVASTTSQVTIQYYIRVPSITNSQEQNAGIINNTEALVGTYSTGSGAGVWTKVTYSKTSSTFTTISGLFLHRILGTGGDMFVDDMAVYTGAVDNTAPSVATAAATASPTASTLDVSWTAAAGGVDGGGYIVVRGLSDPTTAPNVNGIYAVSNLVATGMTVVYRGTGTSFTDGALATGTQYFYRVYSYDKAYNYASSSNCNGITASSCTAPTTQTSALTFSGITPTTQTLNFTRGNGDAGVLVIGKAGSAATDPTSGTSYTGNLAFGSGTAVGTGTAVYNGTTSPQTVTSLTAETRYYYNFYEYNTTGTCYNLTELSGNAWTLSSEPTGHSATFTNSVIAFNQINLAYSLPSTVGADGYAILRRADGTNPTTGGIVNGVAPGSWSLPVGTTLVNANATGTSFNNTGLSGSTNYCYLLVPFNWNAANAETYNYRVAATVPSTCGTTLAEPSSLSNITNDLTFGLTSNFDYKLWQTVSPQSNTGDGLGMFNFIIRDGGGASDADALPTILNSITFNCPTFANIRSASLFTTSGTHVASVAVSSAIITFTGLSGANVTAADNGNIELILRLSFNSSSASITDNSKIVFTITSATAASSSTSSLFATTNAGGAISDNDGDNENRLEVTADRLRFVQQPSNTTNAAIMTPAVTIKGEDINLNQDLDLATTITVACSTPAALTGNPVSVATVSSVSTFSTLTHTIDGTYTLTATATGLTSAVSSSYVISTFNYLAGDFRPLFATDLSFNGQWEYYNGSAWGAAPGGLAPQNTATTIGRVLINTYVSGGGSATKAYNCDFIILAGGELDLLENDVPPVAAEMIAAGKKIEVQLGGILNVQGDIDIASTGNVIVRNGGQMILNQASINNVHPIWDGLELFEGGSEVKVLDWNFAASATVASLINVSTAITSNANGWKFGNLLYDINSGVNDWSIIGGGIGIINLTENNFTITNASTTNYINCATNKTGTNGFIVNGNMTVLDGNIGFGTSFSADPFSHQFTVNGNFSYSGNDIIKMHRNGASTASTLNSFVNVKGNFAIENTCIGFNSDKSTANTVAGLNLNNSTGLIQLLTVFPTAVAVPITIKNLAIAQLSTYNLNLNSVTSVTSDFTVEGGAFFDFNWAADGTTPLIVNRVTSGTAGTSRFVSNTAAILKITSAGGLISDATTYGTTIGNVQNFSNSNRVISSIETFWYTGKVSQSTGDAIGIGLGSSNAKVIICDLATNDLQLNPLGIYGMTSTTTVSPTGGKLDIRKGKVIETETAYCEKSGGTLYMAAGTYYKIVKGSSTAALAYDNLAPGGDGQIPRLSGATFAYSLVGGTIELGGNTANNYFQILNGGNTYYNILYSGSNTSGTDHKGISSNVVINNNLEVSGTVIVDCKDVSNNPVSFTGNAGITMSGGRMRFLSRTNPQPELTGTATAYALTGGVLEFYANAPGSLQSIKGTDGSSNSIDYNQIEVTGSAVGNSNANITLRSGGTFTVKPTGVFEINDNAIVGPSVSQTVTVETGGVFKTGDVDGFAGGTGVTATSVRADIESVILQSGSTVEYSKNTGVAQIITNTGVTSPVSSNYYNLTISGSGNKTAPSGNLVIAGNITGLNTATFAHNSGTVVANGTAGQTYSATVPFSMYKLTNSSTSAGGGLTINSNLIIENEIALASLSRINLNTGDVVIKSNLNATAALAAVPNEAGIISYTGAGRFNIQRYLPGVKAWRLLATPVDVATSPTITDSWREGGTGLTSTGFGTRLTGPGSSFGIGAKFDEYSIRVSMKSYNMGSNNFTDITETDLINGKKIANDDGYYIFVRGDRGVDVTGTGTPTILQIKGQVRTGNQTFGVDPNRFRSIGNPFPSRLDMRNVYLGPIKLQSFYVWNPSGAGNYNAGQYVGYTFTGTNFTNGAAVLNHIESGQAFFVQNNDPGALNLVIKETDKTTGSANVSRGSATSPTLEINLKSTDANGTEILADGTMLNFDNAYSNGIDNYDVKKISNSFDNIAIKSNGTSLLVERKTALVVTDSIHLNISNMRTANYKFEIDPSLLVYPELTAYLKDRFLQSETEVSLTSVTNINFATTTDAASKAANRFVIVFRPSTILPVTFVDIAAIKNANKTHTVKWAVANEINIQQYDVERSSNGSNFVSIGNTAASQQNDYNFEDATPFAAINFYRVKAVSQNGQVQYSAIVKLTTDVKDAYFVVSPNPVQNKTINLQLNGLAKGNYTVNLINSIGQKVFSSNLYINGDAQTKSILLSKLIAEGKYTLQIISSDNLVMSQQILILPI